MGTREVLALIEIMLTIAYVVGWLGRVLFPTKPVDNHPLPLSD